jgi:chromosome segregation ATPase
MSVDRLFEYEEELRAGGAPNAEVFTKALRGVLRELKQERSGMEASVTELKGGIDKLDDRFDKLDASIDKLDARVDKLDARVDKLDHKVDAVELRLNARIDLVKAELTTEIRNSSLEIMKAMNNQLYKTMGAIGTIIAVFYLIEKFT